MIHRSRPLSCCLGLLLALAPYGGGQAAPAEVALAQTNALLAQCKAVLPQAEPRRARELRLAMFQLQLSMAWRRAPGRLSAQDLRSATASERSAYELLRDRCKPLLL
ncbi:hypothetical protein D0B54_13440 [Solimonas sp. K1W22B-7]|nr:hypothetical protein D0B54_13440 [Solimonas sp. K1W22B-7]